MLNGHEGKEDTSNNLSGSEEKSLVFILVNF